MTALIRNLATMTRVGLLAPGLGGGTRDGRGAARRRASGCARRASTRSRVLAALRTYAPGRGVRGRRDLGAGRRRSSTRSTPRSTRRSATSSRPASGSLLALDVSGSMSGGAVAGVPGLTPRVASAAMALVTAATEPRLRDGRLHAGKGG